MSKPTPPLDLLAAGILAEVRYSLPQLLQELEIERASGSFSMEKLDQKEIGTLFKARRAPRRVKPRK